MGFVFGCLKVCRKRELLRLSRIRLVQRPVGVLSGIVTEAGAVWPRRKLSW